MRYRPRLTRGSAASYGRRGWGGRTRCETACGAAAPEGGSVPSCDKQEGVRPGRLPGTAWREPSNDNKRKQVTEFRRTPE